jgi:MFS family permease
MDETGRRRGGGRAALILGVILLVLCAGGGVLTGLAHQLTLGLAAGAVGFLVFGVTGVVVAYHQPRNPVGWILIAFPFLFLLGADAQYYAVLRYHLGHSGLPFGPAAVLVAPVTQPSLFVLPLAILLFPDGRLTSARWRWVLLAYAVLGAIEALGEFAPAVAAVATRDIRVDATGDIANPPGLPGWLAHPSAGLLAFVLASIGVIWLSFVVHQMLSWRQADGVHRQQLKWLASGAAVALAVGVAGSAATSGVLSYLLAATLIALPISIGVGILRYRLYEIDRIISRTLAYAIVTGLLIGVYTGLVLLATHLLTFSSSVAVAASTLVAAALFNPLRRRVQNVVDRRFNRARYDADQTVAAFAARLKDAVDLDSVRTDLAAVVQRTLEPAHVTVWVSRRGPGVS